MINTNSIIQADCIDALRNFDSASIDLTVFSPPYDQMRDYQGEWVYHPAALGKELFRVTKDGGVCAVVIGDATRNFAKSLSSFRLAVDWCDNAGWRLFETCIYQRHGSPGGWWNSRFRVDHEYILIFFKGAKPKTFDKTHLTVPSKYAGTSYQGTDRMSSGGFTTIEKGIVADTKCRGTVWEYSASCTEGNPLKNTHPATFPDRLASDLIRCFSQVDDIVLDPMCGSGTTCVLAARNDRRFIGIDVSEKYCAIARRRLADENHPRLFGAVEATA